MNLWENLQRQLLKEPNTVGYVGLATAADHGGQTEINGAFRRLHNRGDMGSITHQIRYATAANYGLTGHRIGRQII